jgi:hypothetical protein
MKTTSCTILRYFGVAAVVAAGLSGSAWAANMTISNKIQYGSQNTYFAYAKLSGGATWDEAEALAEALPTHNGLSAHLAVFSTEDSYNWMVTNISNFTSPSINDWDQAWIGGFNNAGTYEWIGGGGSITTHWDTTWNPPQPKAANYGVAWMFGSYGDVWTTEPIASTNFANAVVQYGYAVPEPGTWALLLGAGGLFALLKRRASRKG